MSDKETRSGRNEAKKRVPWILVIMVVLVIIVIGVTIGGVMGSQGTNKRTVNESSKNSESNPSTKSSTVTESSSEEVSGSLDSDAVTNSGDDTRSTEATDSSVSDVPINEDVDELPADAKPDGAGNYVSSDDRIAYIPQDNGTYITLPTSATPYTGRGYKQQLKRAEFKRENLEKGVNKLSDEQLRVLEEIGEN